MKWNIRYINYTICKYNFHHTTPSSFKNFSLKAWRPLTIVDVKGGGLRWVIHKQSFIAANYNTGI